MAERMNVLRGRSFRLTSLAAVALAAYAGTLGFGFVYDDNPIILHNPWLRDASSVKTIFASHYWGFSDAVDTTYYRPLAHLLNLVLYQVAGPSAFWFHLWSVALHALNVVFFSLVCEKFLATAGEGKRAPRFSLIAALLFAVHPANIEAVSWVSSANDLLYAFFCLVSLLFFLEAAAGSAAQRSNRIATLISLVGFFLATLCKETAIVLPLVLLACEWSLRKAPAWQAASPEWARFAPYALVGAFYFVLRFAALGSWLRLSAGVDYPAGAAIASVFQGFLWEVKTLLWPGAYAMLRDLGRPEGIFTPKGLALAAGTVGVLSLAGRLLTKNRVHGLAAGLLLLPLLPGLYAYAQGSIVAERYLYLPATGFCMLIAWPLSAIEKSGWRSVAAVALAALFLVVASQRRQAFKDEYSLWSTAVANAPEVSHSHVWLAVELFKQDRVDEGMKESEIALALGFSGGDFFYNYAFALKEKGRLDEAAAFFRKAIALSPGDRHAYSQLGFIALAQRDPDGARGFFSTALRLDANDALSHYGLGLVFEETADFDAAKTEFKAAATLDPGFREARDGLTRVNAR